MRFVWVTSPRAPSFQSIIKNKFGRWRFWKSDCLVLSFLTVECVADCFFWENEMRSILCSGAVLLFVLLSINGLVVVDGASCKGGRSVRGYDLLDDLHRYSPSSSNSLFMTSSCCDDEQGDIVTCHGGVVLQASDVPATATKAIDGQDDAHHTLTLNDAQRHKRWKTCLCLNQQKEKSRELTPFFSLCLWPLFINLFIFSLLFL